MTELITITEPEVKLLTYSGSPVLNIVTGFQSCYSENTPYDLWLKNVGEFWDVKEDSSSKTVDYIEERLATEHTSPLEHASFTFSISGVSRTFTHQFVRHRVGVSISQQSQRYVDPLKDGFFRYVEPAHLTELQKESLRASVETSVDCYTQMFLDGASKEDARAVLPGCTATNMMVTINFAALLHMADIRLCTLAQREFRMVVSQMRAEIKRRLDKDIVAKFIQPKCGPRRQGFCDESKKDYYACPLSRVRPHRDGHTFVIGAEKPTEEDLEMVQS